MSIAIFPAAGGLGGATLNHLLNFIPPKDVVLVARKPEKLAQEKELGATIRRADYDDASTVQGAFDGVKILNLISYQSAEHEHRVDVSFFLLIENGCVARAFFANLIVISFCFDPA